MVMSSLYHSSSDELPVVSNNEDKGSHRDSEDISSYRTAPQRLPYTMCWKLEDEMTSLMATG